MSAEAQTAIEAWNMAGGCDWSAIPVVAAVLGFDDLELLARLLVTIRDGMKKDD